MHAPGSPLRGREPGELIVGDDVLLCTRIVQPGGGEAILEGIWVEVRALRRPIVGRVVTGPRAHAPALTEGQEVTFLTEHVAAVCIREAS